MSEVIRQLRRGMLYSQAAHLTGGHSKGITGVAFNPDGSLLASAGLDGMVCVWNTTTWALLDVYYSKTRVTAIAWFGEEALVCGLEDGTLSALVKDGNEVTSVSGFWAHLYPIEHLSVRDNMLASGAHEELSIWNWDANPAMACLIKSLPPPRGDAAASDNGGAEDSSSEVLVTSVAWASSFLIVTYLNHGIRLFDTANWGNVRVIDSAPIVCASLSQNGAFLAAAIPGVGFNVYDLDSGNVIRTFPRDTTDQQRAVPVLFVHGGHAIACGSVDGKVSIWYVSAGLELEPLAIPKGEKVLAIAAHYYAAGDRFVLATGVMNEDAPSSIIIWVAGGDASPIGQSNSDDGESDDEDVDYVTDKKRTFGSVLAYCCTVFILVFAVGCYVLSENWGLNVLVDASHDEL